MRPDDNTEATEEKKKAKKGCERLEGCVGSMENGNGVVSTFRHDGNRSCVEAEGSVTSWKILLLTGGDPF